MYYFFHIRLEQSRVRSIIGIIRNYYLLGQGLIDKTAVLAGLKDKFTFILEGKEDLMQMRDGGILISGHVGNWEVGGKALDFLDKKIYLVVMDGEETATIFPSRMRISPEWPVPVISTLRTIIE